VDFSKHSALRSFFEVTLRSWWIFIRRGRTIEVREAIVKPKGGETKLKTLQLNPTYRIKT